MPRSVPFVLAALLSAGLGAPAATAQAPAAAPAPAAASAPKPAVPSVQYVRVEGADYMFHVQASIKPGLTVFNLVNVGRDVHAMTVLQMPAGRTMKQFMDAFHGTGKPPAWMTVVGETPTIKPGAEAFITARLVPGRYVLACLIAATDGRSHTEIGMIQLVTAK